MIGVTEYFYALKEAIPKRVKFRNLSSNFFTRSDLGSPFLPIALGGDKKKPSLSALSRVSERERESEYTV